MTSLKQQLIRLGNQRPGLRRHLKPILDTITASRHELDVMYDVTMTSRSQQGFRQLQRQLEQHPQVHSIEYLEVTQQSVEPARDRHAVGHRLVPNFDVEMDDGRISRSTYPRVKSQLEEIWEDLTGEVVDIRVEDVLPTT